MANINLPENPYYNWEETLAKFMEYSEYEMSFFSDRAVQYPWQFIQENKGTYYNPDTGEMLPIVRLKHYEGTVAEAGTPLSEKYIGNMDISIAVLFQWIRWFRDEILTQKLKTEGLELTTLNGMIANAFAVTFDSLDASFIKVTRGYYKESTGEVWG